MRKVRVIIRSVDFESVLTWSSFIFGTSICNVDVEHLRLLLVTVFYNLCREAGFLHSVCIDDSSCRLEKRTLLADFLELSFHLWHMEGGVLFVFLTFLRIISSVVGHELVQLSVDVRDIPLAWVVVKQFRCSPVVWRQVVLTEVLSSWWHDSHWLDVLESDWWVAICSRAVDQHNVARSVDLSDISLKFHDGSSWVVSVKLDFVMFVFLCSFCSDLSFSVVDLELFFLLLL